MPRTRITYKMAVKNVQSRQLLSGCVSRLAKRHFPPGRIVVVSVAANAPDIGLEDVHKAERWPIVLYGQAISPIIADDERHGSYVIVVATAEELSTRVARLQGQSAWNPSAPVVAVLAGNHSRIAVMEMLRDLARRDVLDVAVVTTSPGSVNLYTWFPYKEPSGRCRVLKHLVRPDSCDCSLILGNKVPPRMPGCSLLASAVELRPFVMAGGVDGLDVRLVRYVAQGLNANLLLKMSVGVAGKGILQENGSWTGLRAELAGGLVDLVLGSFLPTHKDHLAFQVSRSYFSDSFTWIVRRAAPYPRWLVPARVFAPQTWLVILLAVPCTGVALRAVARISSEELRASWLCAWGILLGVAVPRAPLRAPPRAVFLGWLVHAVALGTVFQSVVTSLLLEPGRRPQVRTFPELLTHRYVFAVPTPIYDFLPPETVKRMCPRVLCDPTECLRLVAHSGDRTATHAGKAVSRYFSTVARGDLFAFQQSSFELHASFLLQRFSLRVSVDDIVTRAVEAGLPDKWLRDVLAERPRGFPPRPGEDYKPLALSHLQSAFVFLNVGHGLGILTFLAEKILHDY